jgi:hypothetical protein
VLAAGDVMMCVHRPIDSYTPLVKLDSRVEPRVYLREATLRVVRNPDTVTLTRELKSLESFKNAAVDISAAKMREWSRRTDCFMQNTRRSRRNQQMLVQLDLDRGGVKSAN